MCKNLQPKTELRSIDCECRSYSKRCTFHCAALTRLPGDFPPIAEELARQVVWSIISEPNSSIGALFHRERGARAAHVGAHPPGTHRVDGDVVRPQRLSQHDRQAIEGQLR